MVVHKSRMTDLRLSAAPGATNAAPTAASSASLPATTSSAAIASKVAVVAAGKNEVAKEGVVSDNEGMSDAETKAESDTESALDLLRKAASGHSPTD